MANSNGKPGVRPKDLEKLAGWEGAVRLAEEQGLFKVLRGAEQDPASRYVPAALKLAAVLRAAQTGEPPQLRAMARKLWDRASGLSKPGERNARGQLLSEWLTSILDAEAPAVELFENLRLGGFDAGSEKTSALLELLKTARSQPLAPRTLPMALTMEELNKMKRNAFFVFIEAMLRADKEPGYVNLRQVDGSRVRKKYERRHRKSAPKR